jgi:hypothetical protein
MKIILTIIAAAIGMIQTVWPRLLLSTPSHATNSLQFKIGGTSGNTCVAAYSFKP